MAVFFLFVLIDVAGWFLLIAGRNKGASSIFLLRTYHWGPKIFLFFFKPHTLFRGNGIKTYCISLTETYIIHTHTSRSIRQMQKISLRVPFCAPPTCCAIMEGNHHHHYLPQPPPPIIDKAWHAKYVLLHRGPPPTRSRRTALVRATGLCKNTTLLSPLRIITLSIHTVAMVRPWRLRGEKFCGSRS